MKGCEPGQLVVGETFDPRISRMQAGREMSRFEPATQCFRVNAELQATVSKRYQSHGEISFHSTKEYTGKRRESGKAQSIEGDSLENPREGERRNPWENSRHS